MTISTIEGSSERRLESLVDVTAPTVAESAHLDVALDALTSASHHWIPVLDDGRTVVGTIATSDVVRGYRLGLLASLQQMNGGGEAGGMDRVRIDSGSALAGRTLRRSGLPISLVVTTIERKRDLVVPDGDTVLESGDELVLIGRPSDIDIIRRLAVGGSPGARDRDSGRPDSNESPSGSVIAGTESL